MCYEPSRFSVLSVFPHERYSGLMLAGGGELTSRLVFILPGKRDLQTRPFDRICYSAFCSSMARSIAAFGLSSPFLPAFLTARRVDSEWLGFLLGAGTVVRLISAPLAGRLADVFGAFRTRARSVCIVGGRGVAALFACALFLAIGFGEPISGCHAGTASAAFRCTGALLVSLYDAQIARIRIRLGPRHRFRCLHDWRARRRTNCEPCAW